MSRSSFNGVKIDNIRYFKKSIVNYFNEFGRKFPWRDSRSPFKVLVSEILLQQTNAEKVVPVFDRLITDYSTPNDLAKADLNQIRELTRPLGLFYRAERLIDIATIISGKYGGHVPENFDLLKEIKGIGDYTASAVMSFGFNKPYAIVDTNVIRVFERFFEISSRKKRPHTDKGLWNISRELLYKKEFKEYNYGLLDFSANICTARNPKCGECLINSKCKFNNMRHLKNE